VGIVGFVGFRVGFVGCSVDVCLVMVWGMVSALVVGGGNSEYKA